MDKPSVIDVGGAVLRAAAMAQKLHLADIVDKDYFDAYVHLMKAYAILLDKYDTEE